MPFLYLFPPAPIRHSCTSYMYVMTILYLYAKQTISSVFTQCINNPGPNFFCCDLSYISEASGDLGLLFLETVTVPLPICSSTTSQGKWKKSNSCPCSYCKGEEANSGLWLHLSQQEAPSSCSNSCCYKAGKWRWQRENRGNVKKCSPQVCFLGMFHNELPYFLHLSDWDKVFKGWNNVLCFFGLVQLWANCHHLNI